MKYVSSILILAALSLSACAKDGSVAGVNPRKWQVGVQPPEQMNRNDAYTYQSTDDYCTKELKERKGC